MLESMTNRRSKSVKTRCPSYGKTHIGLGDALFSSCPYRTVCRFKGKCIVSAAERIEEINKKYKKYSTRRIRDAR